MQTNAVRFADEPIVVTTSRVAVQTVGAFLFLMGLISLSLVVPFWAGDRSLDNSQDLLTCGLLFLGTMLVFGLLFFLGFLSTPRGRWILDSEGIDFHSHDGESVSLAWRDVQQVDQSLYEFHGSRVLVRLPWAYMGSSVEKQCKPKIREALAPYIDFPKAESVRWKPGSPATWIRIFATGILVPAPFAVGAYLHALVDSPESQLIAILGALTTFSLCGWLFISTLRIEARTNPRWLERKT